MRRINSDLYAWFGKSDDETTNEGQANMIEKQILKKTWADRFLKFTAAFLVLEVLTMLMMVPYMIGRASVDPCDREHALPGAYSVSGNTSLGDAASDAQPISTWATSLPTSYEVHNDLLHVMVNQPDCDQETIRVHTGASIIDVTIGPARVEATINPAPAPATRSAGVNNLRNIGTWLDASGGQVSYDAPTIPIRLHQHDSLTVWPEFNWASTGSWAMGWFSYPRFTP